MDGGTIYGQKGTDGVILEATIETFVIGLYDEYTQLGNAANIVQRLGNYLQENGY